MIAQKAVRSILQSVRIGRNIAIVEQEFNGCLTPAERLTGAVGFEACVKGGREETTTTRQKICAEK